MIELKPVFYVIAGLILRIAIPIGITALLGWFLNRLDARWQAEANLSRRFLREAFGEIQATLIDRTQPDSIQPCWEHMNCSPSVRDNCPVYGNLGILCWEFFTANGTLRSKCQDCTYRQRVLSIKESLA